ncbi:hypothetical protein [Mycobacterium phage WXIN]|nr:hypothetical protein [Mycobacterium phage WXIN]
MRPLPPRGKHCPKFKDGSVCMRVVGHYGECESFSEWLDSAMEWVKLWSP